MSARNVSLGYNNIKEDNISSNINAGGLGAIYERQATEISWLLRFINPVASDFRLISRSDNLCSSLFDVSLAKVSIASIYNERSFDKFIFFPQIFEKINKINLLYVKRIMHPEKHFSQINKYICDAILRKLPKKQINYRLGSCYIYLD